MTLEEIYNFIDDQVWDSQSEIEINNFYLESIDKLNSEGNVEGAEILNKEREAISFVKSVEDGLKSKISGTRKNAEGIEVVFEWPDRNNFEEKEFEYLRKRFLVIKNLQIQLEIGLFLYYSKKLPNDEVIKLLTTCFKLVKDNHQKTLNNTKYYAFALYYTIKHSFKIASSRKSNETINNLFQELKDFTYNSYLAWRSESDSIQRIVLDLTKIFESYANEFEGYDLERILDFNWNIAEIISKTNLWGAIYISDNSQSLSMKIHSTKYDWRLFTAKQYESLADESETKGNMAAISFIENAMKIYKESDRVEELNKVQLRYQELRTKFHLSQIKETIPEDETVRLFQSIRKAVEENNEQQIIEILAETPMILPMAEIEELSKEMYSQSPLFSLIPKVIKDKFGNTVKQYSTDPEKNAYSILETYSLHFQIACQTIFQFYFEALNTNKFSYSSIISYLGKTWLGTIKEREIMGVKSEIDIIKSVDSGLKIHFVELTKVLTDREYTPDLIATTDSLITKAEYLLRIFCEQIGIPTFKPKPKSKGVFMEKNLDDILTDLNGKLNQNDHYFLKYILTEKAGLNLRNKVAHGLMDNTEYSIIESILSVIIILKISSYKFT